MSGYYPTDYEAEYRALREGLEALAGDFPRLVASRLDQQRIGQRLALLAPSPAEGTGDEYPDAEGVAGLREQTASSGDDERWDEDVSGRETRYTAAVRGKANTSAVVAAVMAVADAEAADHGRVVKALAEKVTGLAAKVAAVEALADAWSEHYPSDWYQSGARAIRAALAPVGRTGGTEFVAYCSHPNQTIRLSVWQCPDCGHFAEILPATRD